MKYKKSLRIGLVLFLPLMIFSACSSGKTSNVPDLGTQQTQIAVQQTQIAIQQTQVALNLQTTQMANSQNGNSQSDQPNTPQPNSNNGAVVTSPETRLFWDDFENGIKSEWGLQGDGFASVNGLLIVDKGQFTSAVIGDSNWRNYKIRFSQFKMWQHTNAGGSNFRVMLRVRDRDNYMTFSCSYYIHRDGQECNWGKVINGVEQPIPGGYFRVPNGAIFEVEVENDVYRIFANNERQITFVDTDFSAGGFMIQRPAGNAALSVESIEVFPMP